MRARNQRHGGRVHWLRGADRRRDGVAILRRKNRDRSDRTALQEQMLLALAMLFAGCAMVLLVDGTDAAVIGTVVAIGGLLLWLKARFGAWYANG
jgi:uncharacterized membrane protein